MTHAGPGSTVALVFNSTWYAWKFRVNTIRALRAHGHAVTVIAPPDEALAHIQALEGISYIPWYARPDGRNPLHEGVSLIALMRILRRVAPAFVFSFSIKPNIYTGLACRTLRIPHAPNVTGLGMVVTSAGLAAQSVGRLYALACSGASCLFVQNNHDLDVLKRLGLRRTVPVVQLGGSGVDLVRFAVQPMPPEPPRTFIFIGRLQEHKGVQDFVAAARVLRNAGVSARFVVVGGTQYANTSRIAAEVLDGWRSEAIVEFVGSQEDVRPWIQQAHVLVLPSRGEGMPRVVLEAASSGRPSIVTDVRGCRDAVIDGQTGFIVPLHDVTTLASTMKRVSEMPHQQLEEMGRKARALVEANFSEEHVIKAYLDCIERSPLT